MNWVYQTIGINKKIVWLLSILFLLMCFPIAIISLLTAGIVLQFIAEIHNFNNHYISTLLFFLLFGFVMALIYYFIIILPIRFVWASAKSSRLFADWYSHKNLIGKDIYHLLEFYNQEEIKQEADNNLILKIGNGKSKLRNAVLGLDSLSCIVEECLNEKQIKYEKRDDSKFQWGYFKRQYRYKYFYFVFPLLNKIFPTSIRDFSNYRKRIPRGVAFQLPDNELYILVGIENIGNLFIPTIFSITPVEYIQICGVDNKNKTYVQELEFKITEKLKQNLNIKFLTDESVQKDIKLN